MLDEHLYSITLGNVGEAFFSPHNIRVLRSLTHERFPRLNLYVLTNGSLVTPRTWAKLGEGGEKIRAISVSIDGATPEVYEKLRVPAKRRVLCRNMEFVGRMRCEGRLDMFRIQCIVQGDNICDIAKLYDKAVEWGESSCFRTVEELGGLYTGAVPSNGCCGSRPFLA